MVDATAPFPNGGGDAAGEWFLPPWARSEPCELSAETRQTVEYLRLAACWLRSAADWLEDGGAPTSGRMVALGRVYLEDAEQHVAILAEGDPR